MSNIKKNEESSSCLVSGIKSKKRDMGSAPHTGNRAIMKRSLRGGCNNVTDINHKMTHRDKAGFKNGLKSRDDKTPPLH